ncbi:hypothetical protein [Paenibacillus sanguinis]|uniref:hypothetical protein n=1 Tax=Paenibacillus sanguinis TaxID=225906 RepID=UPI00035E6887|nr:hypothetical protein [Paenibacillus sanguinis]
MTLGGSIPSRSFFYPHPVPNESGSQFKQLFALLVAEGQLWREQDPFSSQQYLHDMLDGLLRYAEPVLSDSDMRLKMTLDYRKLPAWRRHSAIRKQRFFFIDWNKWLIYAPYVINQQMDETVRLLTQSPSLREIQEKSM